MNKEQIIDICTSRESLAKLANMYGVSRTTIVKTKRKYAHTVNAGVGKRREIIESMIADQERVIKEYVLELNDLRMMLDELDRF